MAFDQYRGGKPGPRSACSVCGEAVAGRVAITLQERAINPKKKTGEANRIFFPAVCSTSKAFCEKHAIEVYEAARKAAFA